MHIVKLMVIGYDISMQKNNLSKLEIAELKHLHLLCFNDGENYINHFLRYRLKKSTCFLEKFNDKIVGVLYSRPMKLKLGKNKITIPFITGVATHSDFRNRGIAKKLLDECILFWTKKRAPFALLYPFNHDFYRKQSFQTVSYVKTIVVSSNSSTAMDNSPSTAIDNSPTTAIDNSSTTAIDNSHVSFKKSRNIESVINSLLLAKSLEPVAMDTEINTNFSYKPLSVKDYRICKDIYNKAKNQELCYQLRDTKYFKDMFLEHFTDSGNGLLILMSGKPIGYILYSTDEVKETIIPLKSIEEFAAFFKNIISPISKSCNNFNLDFFYNPASHQSSSLYDNSDLFATNEYAMARVCDTTNLLKNSLYNKSLRGEICFDIGENLYLVSVNDGICKRVSFFNKVDVSQLGNSFLNRIEKCLFKLELIDKNQLIEGALGNLSRNSLFENVFSVYNITMYDKY